MRYDPDEMTITVGTVVIGTAAFGAAIWALSDPLLDSVSIYLRSGLSAGLTAVAISFFALGSAVK